MPAVCQAIELKLSNIIYQLSSWVARAAEGFFDVRKFVISTH